MGEEREDVVRAGDSGRGEGTCDDHLEAVFDTLHVA